MTDEELMKEDKETLVGIIHGLMDVIDGKILTGEELKKRLNLD